MLSISNPIFYQILFSTLKIFLFLGGGFSLIVGIGLILRHELMFRFFEKMNRWVSTRSAMRTLEIPRDSWPFLLRYRYILSVFITVGAIYATLGLTTLINTEAVVLNISNSSHLSYQFISWILSSVKWVLILGCTLSIGIGLMLAFFIAPLEKLEMLSGKWISSRNNSLCKNGDVMNTKLDEVVVSYPTIAGWIVMILSMIDLTLLGMQIHL